MANNNTLNGKKVKAIPRPEKEIGIDTKKTLQYEIKDAAVSSTIDMSSLENFTTISQSREQIYELLDTMANDDAVAAVLETYAEDACEKGSNGHIVWCESSDSEVAKHIDWLLRAMDIDKHTYSWIYSLLKYGDLYIRMYRDSDYEQNDIFKKDTKKTQLNEDLIDKLDKVDEDKKSPINEDIIVSVHKDGDHYRNYVEMVKNPGEMFELTRFGKTMGYIKAPTLTSQLIENSMDGMALASTYNNYKVNSSDITIYQATDFVHACLEDNSSRTPEEVSIYLNEDDYNSNVNSTNYQVKRGQSLLYNSFKIWRELTLLENSILLNRITKSSNVKIVELEVGDMPKEKVRSNLSEIKRLIEQKSALNVGSNMTEYTNPGPVENTVYLPTRGEIGKINIQELGTGEADPRSLSDLEYFRDKFYASLRVPKQFFNYTDDSTGFNGGSSLSIISSRYGKAIKRIQNTFIQAITDLINLILIDEGQAGYIDRFTLNMQEPITQEVLDRRNDMTNEINTIRDLSQILNENVEEPVIRLKMLKELLANSTQNPELVSLIQEEIERIENESSEESTQEEVPSESEEVDIDLPTPAETQRERKELAPLEQEESNEEETFGESLELNEDSDDYLPSFEELGIKNGADANRF